MEVEDRHLVQAFSATLDEGESEAMALYCEKQADFLLIDEKKGRKIAAYNGLKVIGTLGILLLSKQRIFACYQTNCGFITAVQYTDFRRIVPEGFGAGDGIITGSHTRRK